MAFFSMIEEAVRLSPCYAMSQSHYFVSAKLYYYCSLYLHSDAVIPAEDAEQFLHQHREDKDADTGTTRSHPHRYRPLFVKIQACANHGSDVHKAEAQSCRHKIKQPNKQTVSSAILLTLKMLVTTVDALGHFYTG